MRLIGLTGNSRCGKDEVAKVLVREHGYRRVAFADPMRDMLYALDPCIPFGDEAGVRLRVLVDAFGWDIAKREYPEVRALLQRLGTEAGRAVLGERVWVELGLREARKHSFTVFTDCRFANEARSVILEGGEIWRVTRPGVGPLNGHESEQPIPDHLVSRTIMNDGSLSDLAYAVFGAVTA